MAFRTGTVGPRRRQLRAILERAVADGRMREDADLDAAVNMLIGSYYAQYLSGDPFPLRWPEQQVDLVLAGPGPRRRNREAGRRRYVGGDAVGPALTASRRAAGTHRADSPVGPASAASNRPRNPQFALVSASFLAICGEGFAFSTSGRVGNAPEGSGSLGREAFRSQQFDLVGGHDRLSASGPGPAGLRAVAPDPSGHLGRSDGAPASRRHPTRSAAGFAARLPGRGVLLAGRERAAAFAARRPDTPTPNRTVSAQIGGRRQPNGRAHRRRTAEDQTGTPSDPGARSQTADRSRRRPAPGRHRSSRRHTGGRSGPQEDTRQPAHRRGARDTLRRRRGARDTSRASRRRDRYHAGTGRRLPRRHRGAASRSQPLATVNAGGASMIDTGHPAGSCRHRRASDAASCGRVTRLFAVGLGLPRGARPADRREAQERAAGLAAEVTAPLACSACPARARGSSAC